MNGLRAQSNFKVKPKPFYDVLHQESSECQIPAGEPRWESTS